MLEKLRLFVLDDLHHFCEVEVKPVCWIWDDGGGVDVAFKDALAMLCAFLSGFF